MTSPCFGCTERTAICHAYCRKPDAYTAWRERQRAERELDRKCAEITIEGIRRMESRRNKK